MVKYTRPYYIHKYDIDLKVDISLWICHGECCVKSCYDGQNVTVGRMRGERWWVCTVVNICIYTILIEFFRLNANRYIDLTCQWLVSEQLLNYVVRWKGIHIRRITVIGMFGNSTLYLFKNTMLSILFATSLCG